MSDRTDPKSVYRRETSLEWWDTQRQKHDLFVSAEVERELSDPSYPHGQKAIDWIRGLPFLALTDEVRGLANLLVNERVMPSPPTGDALHVGLSAVFGMEYMVSWNVRHLANPIKLRHLQVVCLRVGLAPPQIVTPDLLWEN